MAVIRGERVRALRKEKGWNQDALALKAGVAQTTISDMELNKHKQPRDVRDVARALETTEDYLFGLSDDRAPVQKRGPVPMQLDPPPAVLSNSKEGAITGDAQETNTELSTISRFLFTYGTSLGEDGNMILSNRHIDKVRAPGYAENVELAYYVSICTTDMVPAYWPGDELLIYPEHPVYGGRDYLLFVPKVDGVAQMCKLRRLLSMTETHWVCTAWSPTQHEERISIKDYPIAHWVEGKRNR